MAIYKKLENGDWLKAEESVFVPVRVDKDNLQDGWEYHENDPQEYLDFIDQQNNTEPEINPQDMFKIKVPLIDPANY